MLHTLHWWLTVNKDVIDSALQALLLLATCGLIVVGALQAVAAGKQATAAREQIKASDAQQKELLSQGIAARRPFFVAIQPSTDRVALMNVGPGIAFKTEWCFSNQKDFRGLIEPEPMGAIGVQDTKEVSFIVEGARKFVHPKNLTSEGGIRVEYEDSARKRYFSIITRAPEGLTKVEDTGEIT